jgi:uncharacterized membrane protein
MIFGRNSKPFLSEHEMEAVLNSIRENERGTSGEIRIFIESKCEFVDPIIRAYQIFHELQMSNTIHRNAVLVYIAHKDKDFALFGDKEIYEKANPNFWDQERKRLAYHFHKHEHAEGIIECVNQIGQTLKDIFPSHGEHKNELPDEIIFGK